MIDIDYFKRINDTYGHDKGDIALTTLSTLLLEAFEENSLLARWGGEEFIILTTLMPDAFYDKLVALKNHISSTFIQLTHHEDFIMTISVGLYQTKHNITLDELVKQADTLLYQAKMQGRNRIVKNSENLESRG